MSALRLPLLYAFAGGCLSNAVVFGLWRAAESVGASAVQQPHRSAEVVEVATAASAPRRIEHASELVSADAAARAAGTAGTADKAPEPGSARAAQDIDSAGPTPVGSAVSDVLTRLEAAYRERVAARATPPGSTTPVREAVEAPAEAADATEAARGVPTQAVAAVTPVAATVGATAIEPPAVAPVAVVPAPLAAAPALVAPAAVAAPVAIAAQVAAMPAVAPPVAAAPTFVTQEAPRSSEVHYGDVNQNTYITNVRQGDLYLVQLQQLALLQYMQMQPVNSGLGGRGRRFAGAGSQRVPFPSGITNPDNPWNFNFSPPNLVR